VDKEVECAIEGCQRATGKARGWCNMHYARWRRTGSTGNALPLYSDKDATLAERINHFGWDVTTDGCWEWRGSRRPTGYGVVSVGRQKLDYTHRVSWLVHRGAIPEGMFVCHHCDNPPCCNPDHLFLDDNTGNMADMVTKRRHAFGERNGQAKLTKASAGEIRALKGAESRRVTARRFGVSASLVGLIQCGMRWAS